MRAGGAGKEPPVAAGFFLLLPRYAVNSHPVVAGRATPAARVHDDSRACPSLMGRRGRLYFLRNTDATGQSSPSSSVGGKTYPFVLA
jgi:hypothetical protein